MLNLASLDLPCQRRGRAQGQLPGGRDELVASGGGGSVCGGDGLAAILGSRVLGDWGWRKICYRSRRGKGRGGIPC